MAACAARTRCSVSLMACSMTGRRSSAVSICKGAAAMATFSTSSSAVSTFSMAAGIISSNCLECTPSISRSRASTSARFSSSMACCALICLQFLSLCSSSLTWFWSLRMRSPSASISALSAGGAFCAATPSSAMARCVSARDLAWAINSCCACWTRASSNSPCKTSFACSKAVLVSISASAAFSVAFCTRSSQSEESELARFTFSSCFRASIRESASFLSIACFSAPLITTSSFLTSPSHGIDQPLLGGCMLVIWLRDQTWAPPTWFPNHQPLNAGPSRSSQKYKKTLMSS
mmetsp:Transcript_17323/g.49474  ORF Transcript_17323/g.49474 Transcript_17323/m.49474 type:complete len:291 (+) Transcript_17323:5456-6328(+)